MAPAVTVCEDFGVDYHLEIISAHRTPHRLVEFASQAHTTNLKVIIAGAGGAAHLPGMIAALTPLPVIGVPVPSRYLQGLDSLYSIVQMPAGIPVATVAIGNAQNAGLLAIQILAGYTPPLLEQLIVYRQSLTEQVQAKQARLQTLGHQAYLEHLLS
jgi:5-(carboxyamino)imidazole ribonucleotide mutase